MGTEVKRMAFREPNLVERVFNKVFGFMVGLGFGLQHNYLLQVRGRKTGRTYSTPVNLLRVENRTFLVAPRGRTQWVRNAEAAGEIKLKKGRWCKSFQLRPLSDGAKPALLKLYLDRFATTVRRYFPVATGSELEAFREIANRYPVFELIET
jgi:deazaflavin-dependent oxidoreductase (nitroreductase family)